MARAVALPVRLQPALVAFEIACDETRLRLLGLCALDEANVTELCRATGKTQPAVSHHLALMRTCGAVDFRRAGNTVRYWATPLGREIVASAAKFVRLMEPVTAEMN